MRRKHHFFYFYVKNRHYSAFYTTTKTSFLVYFPQKKTLNAVFLLKRAVKQQHTCILITAHLVVWPTRLHPINTRTRIPRNTIESELVANVDTVQFCFARFRWINYFRAPRFPPRSRDHVDVVFQGFCGHLDTRV